MKRGEGILAHKRSFRLPTSKLQLLLVARLAVRNDNNEVATAQSAKWPFKILRPT